MQASTSFADSRDRAIAKALDLNHKLKRLVPREQGWRNLYSYTGSGRKTWWFL